MPKVNLLHTIWWLSYSHYVAVESLSDQLYIPFGFQTESDNSETGSSYAVDMVYDDSSREVTIVGGTYSDYFKVGAHENHDESDCFVAILHLPHEVRPNSASHSLTKRPSWVRRRQFGNRSASEFCSAIHAREKGGILAAGYSEPGGILEPLVPYGSLHRRAYGTVLDFSDSLELRGGAILHSNRVQYTVDVTSDPSTGDVYIVAISSDSGEVADQIKPLSDSHIYSGGTDLSTTGYTPPMHGDKFSVTVKKFTRMNETDAKLGVITRTLVPGWSREFGTVDLEDVQVSALSYISSTVMVLAGHTKGNGRAFGSSDTSDIDGFLTMIYPDSGNLVQAKRIPSTFKAGNDRVLGLCHNIEFDSNVIYLVGTTDGVFDSTYLQLSSNESPLGGKKNDAFLIKVDLIDMEIAWSRQIEGIFHDGVELTTDSGPQVHAMSCAVTSDGENVYLAGNVKGGASLSIPHLPEFRSSGGNDIFVAKFRTDDGRLEFAQQIGSDEDDSLASGNGIATDGSGNLLLLGNTRGSMYRKKAQNGISDIFTMSINGDDGSYMPPFNLQSKTTSSGDRQEDEQHPDSSLNKRSRYNNAILVTGCLLGMALVLVGFDLLIRHRRFQEEQRKQLEDYLRWLDCDDTVAIEETYTCGWKVIHSQGARTKPATKPHSGTLPHLPSSSTDTTEEEDSVITILGQPRQYEYVRRVPERLSSRREPARSQLETGTKIAQRDSSRRRKNMEGSESTYAEIYDLLSSASQRLSLEATEQPRHDMLADLATGTMRREGASRRARSTRERMSLDDIWDKEFV